MRRLILEADARATAARTHALSAMRIGRAVCTTTNSTHRRFAVRAGATSSRLRRATMISDQERREVAKRLRVLDATITNRDTLEQAVDKFMKAVCGDIPFSQIRYSVRNLCGLAGILADLIDLPTCRNVYDEVYDEYEGAVAKTVSSAASAESSSRIARATASRGPSITARTAGRRWANDSGRSLRGRARHRRRGPRAVPKPCQKQARRARGGGCRKGTSRPADVRVRRGRFGKNR